MGKRLLSPENMCQTSRINYGEDKIMNRIEYLKKTALSFFIIVTFVNVAMGILGLYFEGEKRFGYEAVFFPLIYGFLGVIPAIISYSKKELGLKQLVIRKILQLIFLETLLTGFAFVNSSIEKKVIIWFMISVFIISFFVHIVMWALDSKAAKELNLELEEYQKSHIIP